MNNAIVHKYYAWSIELISHLLTRARNSSQAKNIAQLRPTWSKVRAASFTYDIIIFSSQSLSCQLENIKES